MSWWRVCLFSVALASCTKPNPRSCQDGTCGEPAFPVCDVDGSLGGEPETCIAVECTPGELESCRGDSERRCNSDGTNYDVTRCERGCDEAADGCRQCEPSETVCANGRVNTCDTSGAVVASETCALGYFEDQPRCRHITPSNNLGVYIDMTPMPPDIVLDAARFSTTNGEVRAGTTVIDVPSFLHPSTGNGAPIRVWVVRSLRLTSATVTGTGGRNETGPAAAIISLGDVVVRGELLVEYGVGAAQAGCTEAGRGGFTENGSYSYSGGGGGGGHATAGAAGGSAGASTGGTGGSPSGNPTLVPLRGGCRGGFGYAAAPLYNNGGGALQISSRTRLEVDGIVDANAAQAEVEQDASGSSVQGGGAGGSILLEAPVVILGPDAQLLARGGLGAQCTADAFIQCGAAGNGATATSGANPGGTIAPTPTNVYKAGGGGGGGLGRVRINTADGTYTKSSSVIEDAAVTAGTISSR